MWIGAEEKEHWAEPHYKYLTDNGIKIIEKRFDEPMKRGEAMAIMANIYAHFNR